jgi:hypothetical protein
MLDFLTGSKKIFSNFVTRALELKRLILALDFENKYFSGKSKNSLHIVNHHILQGYTTAAAQYHQSNPGVWLIVGCVNSK